MQVIKYGGESLMLWGCFVAGSSGDLEKINGIMNSTTYQDIFAENLLPLPRDCTMAISE